MEETPKPSTETLALIEILGFKSIDDFRSREFTAFDLKNFPIFTPDVILELTPYLWSEGEHITLDSSVRVIKTKISVRAYNALTMRFECKTLGDITEISIKDIRGYLGEKTGQEVTALIKHLEHKLIPN